MSLTVDSLRLWNAAESSENEDADVKVINAPSMGTDEAIGTSLKSLRSITYQGAVTALRLTQQSGYSSDPRTALAEWLAELESLINGNQGSGYSVTDTERGTTFNVIAETITWTVKEGEPYSADWSFNGYVGEGVMPGESRSADSGLAPGGTNKIGSQDLGHIKSKTMQKRSPMKPFPIALDDAEATIITPTDGPTRETSIDGRYSGTLSQQRSFRNAILSKMGAGSASAVVYTDATTGRQFNGTVASYHDTFKAGNTEHLDYRLTFKEVDIV